MTRTSFVAVAVFAALVAASGCNKPSDAACRKAISNMRTLIGTDSPIANHDIEGDIRRCKGSSKKKAVECAGAATTLEELRACDFMKIHAKPGSADGSGSAAGSAGSSVGSGSAAAAGSAAAGSSDMSGTPPASADMSGSAAGSAAAGSAAAGSAAAGSAAPGSGSAPK